MGKCVYIYIYTYVCVCIYIYIYVCLLLDSTIISPTMLSEFRGSTRADACFSRGVKLHRTKGGRHISRPRILNRANPYYVNRPYCRWGRSSFLVCRFLVCGFFVCGLTIPHLSSHSTLRHLLHHLLHHHLHHHLHHTCTTFCTTI